jgi:hypothetical protein
MVFGQSARKVSAPYNSEFFLCEGKPDGRLHNHSTERSGYNGFRIVADLNFDGREDIILSKSDRTDGVGCGQSGCAVTIFLMQPDKTYSALDYWLHPLAAASRMITPGQGELVTYGRISAEEGGLAFEIVTGDAMKRARVQNLRMPDFGSNVSPDEAVYRYWFYGSLALRAEYSMCKAGKLQWSDSY